MRRETKMVASYSEVPGLKLGKKTCYSKRGFP
jgi:hypothetical protein